MLGWERKELASEQTVQADNVASIEETTTRAPKIGHTVIDPHV